MRQLLHHKASLLVVSVAVLFSACSRSRSGTSSIAFSAAAAPKAALTTIPLNLVYDKPAVVGAGVRVTATSLPPGKVVKLDWGTVDGGWVIEDYYHFRGKKYVDATASLGEFQVNSSGALDASFKIPEDYGGVHEVLASVGGKVVAQNGIEVTQAFELTPASGPVGTPIELKVKGLGWRTMESTWVVNWDNNSVGWVSAASTRGSAVARFRAAGAVGDHVVKLYTGWQGQSYLNYEQSPVAQLPRPQFHFRITPGAPPQSAYAEVYPRQDIPKTEIKAAGAALALTPTQGPVRTHAMLRGQGFPPNASLQLVWQTSVGSRVSGLGFEPKDSVVASVKVSGDGKIAWPLTIPEDLGGLHGLVLRNGDNEVARASFAIETSIVSISPKSGPAGTPVTIHLKGVGWTEYDNIYVATYDNAYMGYACGFNSQGDVVINFTAAGEPGEHLIDLYPGIYEGPPTEVQQLYRLPQLTYADDHPGNKIPALRFAFEVTPGAKSKAPAPASLDPS